MSKSEKAMNRRALAKELLALLRAAQDGNQQEDLVVVALDAVYEYGFEMARDGAAATAVAFGETHVAGRIEGMRP